MVCATDNLPGWTGAPIAEELQVVEDLWDDLAGTPEAVPVHDWQKEELVRRKANLSNNPALGQSWEDVKQRVRGRYGR